MIPQLVSWMTRKHGNLTFRISQIITGHGCFSDFLHKIGKRPDEKCGPNALKDDAQHTLEECESWSDERSKLRRVIGDNLILNEMIGKALQRQLGGGTKLLQRSYASQGRTKKRRRKIEET